MFQSLGRSIGNLFKSKPDKTLYEPLLSLFPSDDESNIDSNDKVDDLTTNIIIPYILHEIAQKNTIDNRNDGKLDLSVYNAKLKSAITKKHEIIVKEDKYYSML